MTALPRPGAAPPPILECACWETSDWKEHGEVEETPQFPQQLSGKVVVPLMGKLCSPDSAAMAPFLPTLSPSPGPTSAPKGEHQHPQHPICPLRPRPWQQPIILPLPHFYLQSKSADSTSKQHLSWSPAVWSMAIPSFKPPALLAWICQWSPNWLPGLQALSPRLSPHSTL